MLQLPCRVLSSVFVGPQRQARLPIFANQRRSEAVKLSHLLIAVFLTVSLFESTQAQLFRRRLPPARIQQQSVQQTPQEKRLIALISLLQRDHVGESVGQEEWQCFSWADYQRFQQNDVPSQIREHLRADEEFAQLVSEIRQLGSREQSRALVMARRTYKPTWQQLGYITRSGQTDAGQRAERDVATAVVEFVEELIQRTKAAVTE